MISLAAVNAVKFALEPPETKWPPLVSGYLNTAPQTEA